MARRRGASTDREERRSRPTICSITEAVKSGDAIAVEYGHAALKAHSLETGEKIQ